MHKNKISYYFCAASILISFNVSALNAAVPSIARSLGIGPNDAALIIPFYMIPYGICALLFAPLSTRFDVKRLMLFSCAVFALGNLISALWTSLFGLCLGRFISGLGAAAVTPLAIMTLGKVFEHQVRGRVLGLFFSASFVGSVLGLTLGIFYSWPLLFWVPAIAGLILTAAFYFCPQEGMEANSGVKINYIDALNIGGLRRVLIFIFMMSLFFNGVCKWYSVYMDHVYHLEQWRINLFIIISTLGASVGQLIGGVISDKKGRHVSLYTGVLILGVATASLFGTYPIFILVSLLALSAIGWTIAHNGISALLTDFSTTYRCELASLNSAVRFFSGGIGFWLSGNFMQLNFGLTFFVTGILMLTQIFFIPVVVNRKG